jgi:NADPH-dependent glutamate synthase beta subunit-like oxidoreductase
MVVNRATGWVAAGLLLALAAGAGLYQRTVRENAATQVAGGAAGWGYGGDWGGAPAPLGRRRPLPRAGELEAVACQQVVLALGNHSPRVWQTLGLVAGERGGPRVDEETMETSRPGVFAGGDLVRGGATVVQAVADGRRAARAMARRILS